MTSRLSSRNGILRPHVLLSLTFATVAAGAGAAGCRDTGAGLDDDVVKTTSALYTGSTNVSEGLLVESDAESQTVAVSMGNTIAVAYNVFWVPVPDQRCPGLSQIGLSYLDEDTDPQHWRTIHLGVTGSGVSAMRYTPSIAYVDMGSTYDVYVSAVAFSTTEWPGYPACIDYKVYKLLPGNKLCVTKVSIPKAGGAASFNGQSCFGEAGADYYDTALTIPQGKTTPYVVSWNRSSGQVSFFNYNGTKLASPFATKTIVGAPLFAKNSRTELVAPDFNGAFWWSTLNPAGSEAQWSWGTPLPLSSPSFPYQWSDSTTLPFGITTLNQYTAVMLDGFMGPGAMHLFYRSGTSLVGFGQGQGQSGTPFHTFTSRPGFNAFMPAAEVAVIPNEFPPAPGQHPMLTYWDDSGPNGSLVLNYTWEGQPVFPFPGSQVPCPVIGAGYWGYRDDMAVRNNNTLTPTLFRFFTDSSHGVCNLKADEADHTTPDHLSETPQHVSAFSVAARSVDWGPISGPHDWNTPAEWEWDQFYWKGTCSIGWGQFGMSNQVVGLAHSILCRKLDPAVFTGNRAATLTMPNSTRRMSRSAGGTTQWAPSGNTILECGNNEYVSGSSENVDNHFHGIRCATAVGLHNTGCNTRVFDNGDSTGATDHPDWDPGFFKGECAATEYMAGVSINTSTSRPHSLLCCPR